LPGTSTLDYVDQQSFDSIESIDNNKSGSLDHFLAKQSSLVSVSFRIFFQQKTKKVEKEKKTVFQRFIISPQDNKLIPFWGQSYKTFYGPNL
jgi:hypothetical protein